MLMSEYQTSLRDIKITAAEQELSDEEQKLLRANEILGENETIKLGIIKDFEQQRIDLEKSTNRETKIADAKALSGKLKHFSNLANALSGLGGQSREHAMAAGRLAQASAVIDTFAGANKAFAQGGILGFVSAAAIIASGLANVQRIEDQINKAQFGMDEVVTKPTMILAGEAGAEQVSITPLEGPNLEGPQGGGGITVNVSGNVLSEQFVEEELSEIISESIRRGTDFGIS